MYPGGKSDSKDGYVAVFLRNLSNNELGSGLEWSLSIYRWEGENASRGGWESDDRRGGDIVKRTSLNENTKGYIRDGYLIIDVRMKLTKIFCGYHNIITPISRSSFNGNIEFLLDDDSTDVAFNIKGKTMYAHRQIIKKRAVHLHVMCEASSKTTPMVITDVDPDIFDLMIRSLYGRQIQPVEYKLYSESLLEAAGKYGFDEIKTEAQVWYINNHKLTVDNAVDEFLKADGNNHEIVRDVTKTFLVNHAKRILESESFDRLYESKTLVKELMGAVADSSKKRKLI